MDDLLFAAWPGELEIRQFGGARQIVGRFPYNTNATMSDRGRVRKESIRSRAFAFAIDVEPTRRIDLLVGHDFSKPIASRQAGSLVIQDADDAVSFVATLPDDPPSWVLDVEKGIAGGLMTGLSPGFQVPPRGVVPNAETLVEEPGNPGVQIRQVNAAVLREFSVVTSGAYVEAAVDLRAEELADFNAILVPSAATLWL